MPFELTAQTEPGARLVALAETHAVSIGARTKEHDRDGTFPVESLGQLRSSGYLTAPIPTELGGLGVTSIHDVVVAQSRLARADASLTLGVNMHFAYLLNVVRRRQIAVTAGDERRVAAFGRSLEEIVTDGTVFAAAISEPRQDLTRPATTAAQTDDGWIVNGRKVFCTMSAAADVLYTAVTFLDRESRERYGYALIPRETPGVVVHHDWDALGMRASGSHSVSFDEVRLPPEALRGGFPVGETTEYMGRNLEPGLFHAAAALGIAESAQTGISAQLTRRDALDPRSQSLAAENVVDLAACRAVLSRAAGLIDTHYALSPASPLPSSQVTRLFAQAQTAKVLVGEIAVRIVDRVLALSGGAGYANGNPIARAYRDVRATAFMHPLGAIRADAFLGQFAVGREPSLA